MQRVHLPQKEGAHNQPSEENCITRRGGWSEVTVLEENLPAPVATGAGSSGTDHRILLDTITFILWFR